MVLKTLPNGLSSTRFGLTVSRRIGKAVIRNKIKRRLREILRRIDLPCGWDIVIIARGPAANADYATLEKSVQIIFKQAGLLLGENEGNSPRTN
jgi:ribonuclease P protein component